MSNLMALKVKINTVEALNIALSAFSKLGYTLSVQDSADLNNYFLGKSEAVYIYTDVVGSVFYGKSEFSFLQSDRLEIDFNELMMMRNESTKFLVAEANKLVHSSNQRALVAYVEVIKDLKAIDLDLAKKLLGEHLGAARSIKDNILSCMSE